MTSRTRSATTAAVVAVAVASILLILGVASQRPMLLILAGATAVAAAVLAALAVRGHRPPVGQPGGPSEGDLPTDDVVAGSRATGGVPDPGLPDQHSTTGSTPSGTFVGRVSGTDPGATEQTGAEVRAEHNQRKRHPS